MCFYSDVPTAGLDPEDDKGQAGVALRPNAGVLPQELRQPLVLWPTHIARVHEAAAVVRQLPDEERRAVWWLGHHHRRPLIQHGRGAEHGHRVVRRLLLPSPPARPQPQLGGPRPAAARPLLLGQINGRWRLFAR